MTSPELNDLRVVNAIPAHIWRSAPDGAVQFVNQQWMDYTGLSQENSQGWGWVSVIHHDDRPGLLDTWRGVLAAGQPEEAEARFRRFDGAYRWYLIRMVPIRDESGALLGWYGANTDIDDLKQAQTKLRQDEKELRQMTDATQLPIIVFSAEGRLLYANRFWGARSIPQGARRRRVGYQTLINEVLARHVRLAPSASSRSSSPSGDRMSGTTRSVALGLARYAVLAMSAARGAATVRSRYGSGRFPSRAGSPTRRPRS